ncbi:MAG: hypothetical protein K9J83_00680 [Desulfarculaceae bacterium]|nr:hypothetical protein [Desulfarculaceae bacterium]
MILNLFIKNAEQANKFQTDTKADTIHPNLWTTESGIMKFINITDLQTKSFRIRKELADQQDMVITDNGQPIAILSSVTEDNLEQVLSSFRQARAMQAVNTIQYESMRKGTDNISMDEIEDEIKDARSKQKT